jgi:aminocarboxymuconate-semialdehyde decarboxylase
MMDKFDGYKQVVSIAGPPPEAVAPGAAVELARIVNDELAELVTRYPDRFPGAIGDLPMNDPDAACREIERIMTDLRLNGVQIYSNVSGKALDAPEFEPVFATLDRYQVPILLHPTRSQDHPDYLAETQSKYLIWQVFGWPYETTAAMMRLVFGGLMDRHPDLAILVHHTGAMVPFFEGRMRSMFAVWEENLRAEMEKPLAKPAIEYFRRFYADTAVFSAASVDCARGFMGDDRVLFGSDAPFDATGGRSSIQAAIAAVRDCSAAPEQKHAVFEDNVRKFFRLEATVVG